jgi:hypothetical protein
MTEHTAISLPKIDFNNAFQIMTIKQSKMSVKIATNM